MNANDRDIDLLIRILDHADRIHACVRRFGDNFDIYIHDPDYQDMNLAKYAFKILHTIIYPRLSYTHAMFIYNISSLLLKTGFYKQSGFLSALFNCCRRYIIMV